MNWLNNRSLRNNDYKETQSHTRSSSERLESYKPYETENRNQSVRRENTERIMTRKPEPEKDDFIRNRDQVKIPFSSKQELDDNSSDNDEPRVNSSFKLRQDQTIKNNTTTNQNRSLSINTQNEQKRGDIQDRPRRDVIEQRRGDIQERQRRDNIDERPRRVMEQRRGDIEERPRRVIEKKTDSEQGSDNEEVNYTEERPIRVMQQRRNISEDKKVSVKQEKYFGETSDDDSVSDKKEITVNRKTQNIDRRNDNTKISIPDFLFSSDVKLDTYVKKIAENVSDGIGMSKESRIRISNIVVSICESIVNKVILLMKNKRQTRLTENEISIIVLRLFKREISNSLVSNAEKFMSNIENMNKGDKIEVTIPMTKIKKIIEQCFQREEYETKVAKNAVVFLTSVIEQICEIIIKNAYDICDEFGRQTLSESLINLSISRNIEFFENI